MARPPKPDLGLTSRVLIFIGEPRTNHELHCSQEVEKQKQSVRLPDPLRLAYPEIRDEWCSVSGIQLAEE